MGLLNETSRFGRYVDVSRCNAVPCTEDGFEHKKGNQIFPFYFLSFSSASFSNWLEKILSKLSDAVGGKAVDCKLPKHFTLAEPLEVVINPGVNNPPITC